MLEKYVQHLRAYGIYGMNLVDCDNSDVYNSQPVIKIKGKKRY